jgi:hypothetical protein
MSLLRWRSGLLALSTGLLLAGCQGVTPGKSPSVEFVVPISVKSAYSRAVEQSKYCLVTYDRFPLTATLAPDEQSASVRVNMNLTGTLLSDVQIRAQGPSQSQVTVTMWGVDVWDATAVAAMRAAIEFGVPSCTNYFPSPDPKKKR